MAEASDRARHMFRHAVATLAYRGGKAVRDVAPSFPEFRASETTRTPAEILAHIGDLLDWALRMARGETTWVDSPLRGENYFQADIAVGRVGREQLPPRKEFD